MNKNKFNWLSVFEYQTALWMNVGLIWILAWWFNPNIDSGLVWILAFIYGSLSADLLALRNRK